MDEPEQGGEAKGPEGGFSRVIGVLLSPRATFDSIAARPTWLVPLLLIMVVNLAVVFTFSHRIGWRSIIEKQLASSTRTSQMTPQQREQAIERGSRIAPVFGYVGVTVGTVVFMLIAAGILLGGFNVVFGTSIRFKQSFALSAYATMPGLVRGLIALLILWVRPPEGVSFQNLVMSNVGAFLPTSSPPWLTTLGATLDVFSFWAIALTGIGFAAASSKRVRLGGALSLIIALWVIYVILIVGVSAIFG